MAFPPEFLDQIRSRLSLTETVGRRVKLTRRGRENLGLCPFHSEKTPSFTVNDDKGFFHCFGCGAHGDIISFVMETEGLAFPEAVERLAGLAGLEMPEQERLDPEERRRQRDLYDLLEAAAAWFEMQLQGTEAADARAYLESRGLSPDTSKRFRLGYAGKARGALLASLKRQGFDETQAVKAGLVKPAEAGAPARDYFFQRIIFPIADARGRIVAFGGRAMGDSKAKYLNSPETPLFHKGRQLYNLHRVPRRSARHDLVVAEGYMDVIAMSQAGLEEAVAPLGTAITEEQLGLLWRLCDEPILCLDGDEAGRRAARRAIERALPHLRAGKSLRFALLPSGEDPDSLIRSQGIDALRALLEAAQPLVEILWRSETAGRRLDTPERQAALKHELFQAAGRIQDGDVKAAYLRAFSQRLQNRFAARPLGRGHGRGGTGHFSGNGGRFGKKAGLYGRSQKRPALALSAAGRGQPDLLERRRDQVFIAALVNHPQLVHRHAEELTVLPLRDPDLNALFRALVDALALQQDLDSEALKCHLSNQGFAGLLGDLLRSDVYVHGRFAKPDAPLEDADRGVREILGHFSRQRQAVDYSEAGRALAEETSQANLDRLEATKAAAREEENLLTDLEES
jgi:DNA primase